MLILTLNEIDGIKEILPQIDKSWAEEIVVIDGGSTDGTVEEAKKMGFSVIIQKNPGHGDAIVTGVNATKSTIDALNFFFPRLLKGGIIIFDDYGNTGYPDTKKQIDEFCIGSTRRGCPLAII